MKCSELDKGGLANAYADALKKVNGGEVTMEHMGDSFDKLGSTCGQCPLLLKAAKLAFEGREAVGEVKAAMNEALPLPQIGTLEG